MRQGQASGNGVQSLVRPLAKLVMPGNPACWAAVIHSPSRAPCKLVSIWANDRTRSAAAGHAVYLLGERPHGAGDVNADESAYLKPDPGRHARNRTSVSSASTVRAPGPTPYRRTERSPSGLGRWPTAAAHRLIADLLDAERIEVRKKLLNRRVTQQGNEPSAMINHTSCARIWKAPTKSRRRPRDI